MTSHGTPRSPASAPGSSPITRAMIFAAGLGTRFKPWTDRHPKALAPVNGKSLLQRNIEHLQRYGIRDVVVNVHHFAGQIVDAIRTNKGWGSEIRISNETDEVLETGGGLKKAAPLLGTSGPFFVINVDILTDLDLHAMADDHFRRRPLATLAVSDRKSSRHFLFNRSGELCGWRNSGTGEEKLTGRADSVPEPKAFSGIHIIEPAIFPLIRRQGKFSMVDVYLDLAATQTITGFDHGPIRLIDVGKPDSVSEAERLFP